MAPNTFRNDLMALCNAEQNNTVTEPPNPSYCWPFYHRMPGILVGLLSHNQMCPFLISSPSQDYLETSLLGEGQGQKLRSRFPPDTPLGTRVSWALVCGNGRSWDLEREGGAWCFHPSCPPCLTQPFILLSTLASLSPQAPVTPYPALKLRKQVLGGISNTP